jgi:hypothetical protein
MKTPALQFTLLLLITALAITSCNDGAGGGGTRVTVDVEQAKGNIISRDRARSYTDNFVKGRQELSAQLARSGDSLFLARNFNLPDAELFNRHAIGLLLNQPGAEGIRILMGRDEKGMIRLVLLPVDKNGENIIGKLVANNGTARMPGTKSAYADDDGEAIENGQRCPTMCDQGW